jgi:tRNA(Ile)-lysidine synthase
MLVLAVWAGHDVTAVHVDHGLRPTSELDAKAVAVVAERFGARFESRRVVVAAGPNLEARARDARYAALPDDVLVGHTADDQAETVVLNLIRGAGPVGLAGIRSDRRPLLELRRSETQRLCSSLGLDVVVDETNVDPRFRRNRVRHEAIPLLSDVAVRDVVPILARAAAHQREVAELVADVASTIDPTQAAALAAAHPLVAGEAVRRWFASVSGSAHPPGRAAVMRVLEVASGEARATDVIDGWRVSRSGGRLRLELACPEEGPAR